jgi:hypothetical protein
MRIITVKGGHRGDRIFLPEGRDNPTAEFIDFFFQHPAKNDHQIMFRVDPDREIIQSGYMLLITGLFWPPVSLPGPDCRFQSFLSAPDTLQSVFQIRGRIFSAKICPRVDSYEGG